MHSYFSIALSIFATLFLNSCGDDLSFYGKPINIQGNSSRNNNYEAIGNFYKELYITEEPDSNHKNDVGAINSPISLDSDKTIVPLADGSIVCIGGKRLYWTFNLGDGENCSSAMCADARQNIYFTSNKGILYSISSKGKLNWKKSINSNLRYLTIFCDLIALDSLIIYGDSEGMIAGIKFDGNLSWSINVQPEPIKTFSAKNNKIYIPLTHNQYSNSDSLICIDAKNGNILWVKDFANTRFYKNAAIGNNCIVIPAFVGDYANKTNEILILDFKGNIKKRINSSYAIRSASLSNEDDIFISAYNSGIGDPLSIIYKFDKNGTMIWDKYFELTIPTPLMLSKENVAFVGISKSAVGTFFLYRSNGNIDEVVDISDTHTIRNEPTINPLGNIIFVGSDKLVAIKIDDTPLNKYLPY